MTLTTKEIKAFYEEAIKNLGKRILYNGIQKIKVERFIVEARAEQQKFVEEKKELEESADNHKREKRDRVKVLVGQISMEDDIVRRKEQDIKKLDLDISEAKTEKQIVEEELTKL